MGSELSRINKYGYKKASAWGTAVDMAAGDLFYPQSISGLDLKKKIAPEKGKGQGFESNSYTGPNDAMSVSFDEFIYQDGGIPLLLLAQIFGTDVVTGASDPYSHTMTAATTSGKFGTLVFEEGSEVKAIPSLMPTGIKIAPNGDGIMSMNVSAIGNTVSIGAAEAISSGAYAAGEGELPFKLSGLTLRMNAMSGDALDSGDDLVVTDIELDLQRPATTEVVNGATTVSLPKEGGYPEWKLSFRIPAKDATSVALFTAYNADTAQKATLELAGTTGDHSLLFSFPRVMIESMENPHDDVISTRVVCRLQKAAAAPTGMTGITYPTAVWEHVTTATVL
jgi:hypothetical protein